MKPLHFLFVSILFIETHIASDTSLRKRQFSIKESSKTQSPLSTASDIKKSTTAQPRAFFDPNSADTNHNLGQVISTQLTQHIKGDTLEEQELNSDTMTRKQKQLYAYRTIDTDTFIAYLLVPVVGLAMFIAALLVFV